MAYTNSPLVNYIKISPNKTSPRNHAIDTITIHCVVGQCDVETLGEVFAPTSRQASSNYGIGYDGKIGMYVEEKDRSWCSSSSTNDNRAITIEVASDVTEPYAVRDAAYDALIKLVADICKRNGIKKLVWSANKNDRVNHLNGCNMTVHRDYANKSCPGTYLYERHADIAAKVNAILCTSDDKQHTVANTMPPVSGRPSTGSDADAKTLWDVLMKTIKNEYGVAGVMGNLYAESALKSTNLENTYEKALGYTDVAYTTAVDNGSYSNFVHDSAGYGLAQWTFWSLKEALLAYAKSNKVSVGDFNMQIMFLLKELDGHGLLADLKTARSVREASNIVLLRYERPADQSETVQEKRARYGMNYYNKFANNVKIKEDEEMTLEAFKKLMRQYRAELQDNDAGDWSQEARDWAVNTGIIQGDDGKEFNGMWQDGMTREQMAVILYRFAKMIGKA